MRETSLIITWVSPLWRGWRLGGGGRIKGGGGDGGEWMGRG